MNRQKRQGVARKGSRAAVGGGAVILAILLYLLFPFGFGGDGGEGDADSDGTAVGDAMMTSAPPQTSPLSGLTNDPPAPAISDEEQQALSGNVLTVLIDEHKYMIEIPTDQEPLYRPTPLERIVELAQRADGDSNGIRVRVLRRDSARASAEEKLHLELNRGDIEDDTIFMVDTTVP